ncbi:MAG: energy-coupled thiamine transporter ThiT [Clostridia bacterium]|nr:energy-coupled thiamine transporter ThiT [Clostridia bacterium]
MENSKKLHIMVEGAIMVALATGLSMIKLITLPWGGSVTLLSMLPIVIFSIRRGFVKGLMTAFVYSVMQLLLGITVDGLLGWGLTPLALFGCIMFDYLLAFTVLGLAGVFGKNSTLRMVGGVILALSLRFVMHYISGVLIFHSFGELWEGFSTDNTFLYSLLYNGFYMLPEIIFTAAATAVLCSISQTRKLVLLKK